MAHVPRPIATFLAGRRIAVCGVSRDAGQPANAIFQRLRASGYDTLPVNPNAREVEGVRCYPDLGSVPGAIDGVVVATHPAVSAAVVRQADEVGASWIWLHRSFGNGSVSDDAIRECEARGLQFIVGGCPLMFCPPVDLGHRCMRWWLQRQGRVPR